MSKVLIYPSSFSGDAQNPYMSSLYTALIDAGISIERKQNSNSLSAIINLFRKGNNTVVLNWWGESGRVGIAGVFIEVLHLIAFLILFIKGDSIFYFVHNKLPHRGKRYLSLERKYFRMSKYIFCHSEEIYAVADIRYHHKIHILRHPINQRPLDRKPINQKEYDFLIWGSIESYKGLKEFITEYKKLDSKMKVAIVGKPVDISLISWIIHEIEGTNISLFYENYSDKTIANFHQISKYVLFNHFSCSSYVSGSLYYSLGLGATILVRYRKGYNYLSKQNLIFQFHQISTVLSSEFVFIRNKEDCNEILSPEQNWKDFLGFFN
jgi:hypothetical protein